VEWVFGRKRQRNTSTGWRKRRGIADEKKFFKSIEMMTLGGDG